MVYFEDVAVGDEVYRLEKPPITRVQLVKYAGASGDFNPLHTDDSVGQAGGTGGVIAHGMLIMGFAGQAVTRFFPQAAVSSFGVRMVGMTRPGEAITVTLHVREKVETAAGHGELTLDVVAKNTETGDVKLKGTCRGTLPVRG